jgi:hypothetical protein
MSKKIITRREFLKTSASAAAAGAVFMSAPDRLFAEPDKKTRVVLIRNKDVLDGSGRPKAEVLSEMLDEALGALVGEGDPAKAWRTIAGPKDVVGVKTNGWSSLRTPKALEDAIERRLLEAGVEEDNLSIDDQGVLRDPVFQRATALVNVRPMRTHNWSGVGSLIKNYIMFSGKPSSYHGDSCADLAKLWKLPVVKGKTRLNILVVLTPLFHGIGPHHYNPAYTWPYRGLLVGTDPVAVDATGLRILQAKRNAHFGEDRPINPPPKHVRLADTRHHLGTADPDKIELVKIGWMEDALI